MEKSKVYFTKKLTPESLVNIYKHLGIELKGNVAVNDFILINENRIVSPYVVKAIGNQTYLSSALSLKVNGFIDSYQKLGKTVKMTKERNVKIDAYNGRKKLMQLNYAKEEE